MAMALHARVASNRLRNLLIIREMAGEGIEPPILFMHPLSPANPDKHYICGHG